MGGGTGVAFYPPFQLMWFISEPDLLKEWIAIRTAKVFPRMKQHIDAGVKVVALGGDVSCDKGPFISPAHYPEVTSSASATPSTTWRWPTTTL